jgi:hypothetical protein
MKYPPPRRSEAIFSLINSVPDIQLILTLSNQQTPCSRALLENVIVAPLIEELSGSRETRMYITVFKRAHDRSLQFK